MRVRGWIVGIVVAMCGCSGGGPAGSGSSSSSTGGTSAGTASASSSGTSTAGSGSSGSSGSGASSTGSGGSSGSSSASSSSGGSSGSTGAAAPVLFVAPNGDDSTCARGDASKPCLTFDKAYKLANPGETVEVEPGTYPTQVILYDANKPAVAPCTLYPGAVDLSGCITFEPPGGGTALSQAVTLGNLVVLGGGVRVRNIALAGADVDWKNTATGVQCATPVQTHDVIIDGAQFVQNGAFHVGSAVYVSLVNSDIGPSHDSPGTTQINTYTATTGQCGNYPSSQLPPHHILIDHDRFHDLVQTVPANGPNCGSDPAQYYCNHMECIHWEAGHDWIISNSRFENCAQYDLSVETNGGVQGMFDNFRIENDFFDRPCSDQPNQTDGGACGVVTSVALICHKSGDALTNGRVRFNSLRDNVNWQVDGTGCSFAGTSEVGNLEFATKTSYACSQDQTHGISQAYNARGTGAVTCNGTEELLPANPYVAPGPPSDDLHLLAGTAAENFVPLDAGCPATDIDGDARPMNGPRCDVGADER